MTEIHQVFRLARAVPIMDVVAKYGLKLRRSGREYVGACPACGDGDDRFSVNPTKKTDGGGVGLFNCRVCETGGDVIELECFLTRCNRHTAARKLARMPDKPIGKGNGAIKAKKAKAPPPKEAANNVIPLPVVKAVPPKDEGTDEAYTKVTAATFYYTDGAGVEVYRVERIEFQKADGSFVLKSDGKREKSFRQSKPDPDHAGAWICKPGCMDGVERVPYRLPEVIEAVGEGHLVYIVEGEGKAEALHAIGIVATTNSGGAGKWDVSFNEHLRGADVVLLPDNDEPGQKHVADIAASLDGVAGRIRILALPGLPEKGDIIDWIKAGGTREQFDTLVDTATDWEPLTESTEPASEVDDDDEGLLSDDPDLIEMNSKYAVVKLGGKTRVIEFEESSIFPGCLVPVYSTIPDFCAFHAKRKKVVGNDTKVGMGKWWIGLSQRRQYDGVVYAPNRDMKGKLNLWTGFACEPKAGDCGLYLAHLLENICSGDEAYYTYLLSWMAHGVQKPGEPGGIAVVLRGREGVGKGVMASSYGGLFGSHYRQVVHAKHLTGHFNAHLQHLSCLFADEAFFAGDRAHENILKTLITEATLLIEPKGVDPYPTRNCIHLIMSSNNDWVVPAGADARRYFVLNVGDDKKQDEDYFLAILHQMEQGGREALLALLLERDLSGFNIRKVPQTDALAEQKQQSRKGVDQLVEGLAHHGVLPGSAASAYSNVAITTGEDRGEGFYAAARKLVPDLRFLSSVRIFNKLRDDWGCQPWKSGYQRGLLFPPLAELRHRFDKQHGSQKWPPMADWGTDENS